jgi:phosphate uptake regulator
MFGWLRGGGTSGEAGLQRMRADFCTMLDNGRGALEMACDALLGEAEVEAIRKRLFETDKLINQATRRIRQHIVVHATVHGATEFPPCLILMSIVKDAERLGDYSKNLYDLATLAPRRLEGEQRERFRQLKDDDLALLADCVDVIDRRDKDEAAKVIVRAKQTEDLCDASVNAFIRTPSADPMAPTYVLAYRYLKRVASHTRNITSSVVQPLHKLDFTSKIVAEHSDEASP